VSATTVAGRSRIRLADDLDLLTRQEVEGLATSNLKTAVEAALAVPSLAHRWPELAAVRRPSDLAHLVPLSPEELAERCPPHFTGFRFDDARSGMVLRSSGTSGRQKVLYHSWEFTEQMYRLGARGVRAALMTPPSRMANCLMPGELNGSFTFAHEIARLLPALTFPLGGSVEPVETAEIMAEHGVDTLVSTPHAATRLVTGVPPGALPALRNLLYIGESFGAAKRGAVLHQHPGLVVRSLAYSTSELGPIGYQCPHCDAASHHVHEDAVLVEVLDDVTGAPAPEGTEGELVVTPFSDTGMALFRYRIGDRGYLSGRGCPCGSQTVRLTLTGRVTHSVTVDTTTVSGDLLMALLGPLGLTDAGRCQLQIRWSGQRYGLRLLLDRVLPVELTGETLTDALRRGYQFRRILDGASCSGLEVRRVDPAQFTATPRGKVPLLMELHADSGPAGQDARG